MTRAPTLAQVAAEAGVSTATVSRVLNDPDNVRPDTRARVMKVVDALGYTPHFGAKALASNRTGIIGAVIPTMENAIFAQGLQAVEGRLAEHGLTMLVATSGYDPAREATQARALIARGAEALLLIGLERDGAIARMAAARDVPVLALWSYAEKAPLPCIGIDNRAAMAGLAQAVRDQGHSQVAMIAGITAGNDRAAARLRGVEDVFGSLPPARLVESPYTLSDGAAAAVRILGSAPDVTALICGNDVLAAGALAALAERGLRCPVNISVTGFDDLELARAVSPPLTTCAVPHRQMGQAAAEAILARLEQGSPLPSQTLDTTLVHRASLGPPRR